MKPEQYRPATTDLNAVFAYRKSCNDWLDRKTDSAEFFLAEWNWANQVLRNA